MAKRVKKRVTKRGRGAHSSRKNDIGDFLPAAPEVVRAIAMGGCTDDELALMMGLNPEIIEAWRKMYPSFDKALEEGRTVADLEVIQALHSNAVGHTRQKDVLVKVRSSSGKGQYSEDVEVHTVTEQVSPETNAIKMWLQNRDPKRWNKAQHLQITGKQGEPAVDGVLPETKMELMSSVLALIQPKPDGV